MSRPASVTRSEGASDEAVVGGEPAPQQALEPAGAGGANPTLGEATTQPVGSIGIESDALGLEDELEDVQHERVRRPEIDGRFVHQPRDGLVTAEGQGG